MFNEANAVENFIRDLTPAAGAAPPLRGGAGAGKRSAPGVRFVSPSPDLTPAAGAAPPLRCGEGAGKRSAPGVRSDGAVAPLRRGRRVQPAGVRSL
jgi:hypothetical protein